MKKQFATRPSFSARLYQAVRSARPKGMPPRGPLMETLEERIALTINYAIPPNGTLDINPISSIIPAGMDRMTVNFATTPGVAHGTIYRYSGLTYYPWGTGAPNAFKPGYPDNRIFGGEGFSYTNNGTGNGTSESIPVTFRDAGGFTHVDDTIVISINSNLQPPTIQTQPNSFIQIPPNATASMSVVAGGLGPFTYQWYKGISPDASQPIAAATSAGYTTPSLGAVQQYYYWVKVTNSGGSVNSVTVTVQVATQTSVTTSDVSTPYKTTNRTVTLNATETPPQNVGKVTYTSLALGGSTADSGTVVNGVAPATAFTVPGNTPVGAYAFEAHYVAPAGIADSYDNKTITITKASTTTAAVSKAAVASGVAQSIPLTATVTSPAGVVAEGTVTFTVFDGANQVGAPATSGTVAGGNASANYMLPANSRGGVYTIKAVYDAGPNYLTSNDAAHTLTEAPLITPNSASLLATATSLIINGFGFDGTTLANNAVTFPAGVTGNVTAATPTQLTVSNLTGLTGGSLTVAAVVRNISGAGAVVATVTPVITQASTVIKPNQMTLTINGYGFSTTAASNVLAFTPGVTNFVSTSTKTQMTVVFTQQPQNGPLNAVVTTNGASSGNPVQVAIVDGIGPVPSNGRINLNGAALGTVSIDLTDDIAPNLLLSHFQVTGVGNPAVTINPTNVTQDPATHTATFSLAAPLSYRNYKGTLTAAGLADANGNPMAADYKFNFFYLPGDADLDRIVGPSDFNLLATSFGATGKTWAAGDFNGDGVVGPSDFNLLATTFGTILPNPPPPLMAPAGLTSSKSTSASSTATSTLTTSTKPTDALPRAAARPKARQSFSAQLLE